MLAIAITRGLLRPLGKILLGVSVALTVKAIADMRRKDDEVTEEDSETSEEEDE